MNRPCLVNVRPERPCRVFQAYIQASNGTANLPIVVHKSAKSGLSLSTDSISSNQTGLDNYEIFFIPTRNVDHWVHVHLNNQPMKENPCRLVARARSTVKNDDELFHAHTGRN